MLVEHFPDRFGLRRCCCTSAAEFGPSFSASASVIWRRFGARSGNTGRIKSLSSYTQNAPDYFPKWARSFSFSLQYISKRSVSGRSSWGILIVKGLLYT